MKKVVLYIQRWCSTMAPYLIKNVFMSIVICTVTMFVVKADVFDSFSATRACLFAVLMCNVWQGIFNSITTFHSESSYIVDDMDKFLPVRTYIAANFIIQFFLCLIEAIMCTIIFYLFFDYSNESVVSILHNRNMEYFITFFLILFSCDMLAFAIGAAIKKVNTLMTAIPLILIVQFLFSGCLFELNGDFLQIASKITTAKWGFCALGAISDLNSLLVPNPLAPVTIDTAFEHTSENILYCWSHLGIIGVFCTLLAGLLLYLRMNSESK